MSLTACFRAPSGVKNRVPPDRGETNLNYINNRMNMKRLTKIEYISPALFAQEVAFEGDICVSKIDATITVEDLEEENGPDHDLEF